MGHLFDPETLGELVPEIVTRMQPRIIDEGACPCCNLVDCGASGLFDFPNPTRARRRTVMKKPTKSLRDLIKAQNANMEMKEEKQEAGNEPLIADGQQAATKKRMGNQGKANTFKRRTKRPGK